MLKSAFIICICFISLGGAPPSVLLGDSRTIERIVAIIPSSGGDGRSLPHSGYVIKDCLWVQMGKKVSGSIHLNRPLDQSYIGKKVRAGGNIHMDSSFRYIMDLLEIKIID